MKRGLESGIKSSCSLLLVAVFATVTTACGHHQISSSLPVSQGQPLGSASGAVAAVGNSEDDLKQSIAQAKAGRNAVRYVTVASKNAVHVFSPYAQVLHSKSALIVRAYSRMYVWPLSSTTVSYSTTPPTTYDTASLPLVTANALDTIVGKSAKKKRSQTGQKLCGDCAALFGKPRKRSKPDPWEGVLDPWQVRPDYAYSPQAVPSSSVAAGGSTPKGARHESGFWGCGWAGCYYYYYENYYYGGGGAPPCGLYSETALQSSLPSYRTDLGINEQATLTSYYGDTWEVSGDASIDSSSGSSVTLTAGGSSGYASIYVSGADCIAESLTYTVHVPSGTAYSRTSGIKHTQNADDVGIRTTFYLQPDIVSFQGLYFLERDATYFTSGPGWACLAGLSHSPSQTPFFVNGVVFGRGSQVAAIDTAYSGSCGGVPIQNSTAFWNIPDVFEFYAYGPQYMYATSLQTAYMDNSGNLNESKVQASGSTTVSSPSSNY